MIHQEKKVAVSDPLTGGKPSRAIYEFLDLTHSKFIEYEIWKLETDLYEIELYGMVIPLPQVNYLQWLEWHRVNELPAIENVDITIDAEFEEVLE